MPRRGIDPELGPACDWLTDWLGGTLTVGYRQLSIPTVDVPFAESSRETYGIETTRRPGWIKPV